MKLKTKKDIRDMTEMRNLVDARQREKDFRREGIFGYFLCFIFFCILAHAYRSQQKTVYGSKRVFPRKVKPLRNLDDFGGPE